MLHVTLSLVEQFRRATEIKTVLKNRRKHRGTKAPFKQTVSLIIRRFAQKVSARNIFARMNFAEQVLCLSLFHSLLLLSFSWQTFFTYCHPYVRYCFVSHRNEIYAAEPLLRFSQIKRVRERRLIAHNGVIRAHRTDLDLCI